MHIDFNELVVPESFDPDCYAINNAFRHRLHHHAMQYYAVPGRHYHTEDHVFSMLKAHRNNFGYDPSDALFLSIILHDAVYIPGNSPGSEEASAQLLPSVYYAVVGERIPMALSDRVFQLIRWTLPSIHVRNNFDKFTYETEAKILLDLDLNGMSNPDWSEFIQTQQNLDLEFQHLGTKEERMQNSATFLKSFVDKGFVYYTKQMDQHNATALSNLKAYIRAVRGFEYDWEVLKARNPHQLASEYGLVASH